jgi:L-glyceraldehyde 3-phosphate reductase
MSYTAHSDRYDTMEYRRCGKSGLKLPAVSLGLWHNFGEMDDYEKCRKIIHTAFDQGITHFDLANNYGPPGGAAEEKFGKVLKQDLKSYRDEIIISSKAGYYMWPGPYGDWGSKKYLVASLDQSLKRIGVDYVDIYYHHRPDPDTPLEESMKALDLIVRQGKALYIGISSYSAAETERAIDVLNSLGTPLLIHQPKYSMLQRWVEEPSEPGGKNLLEVLEENGVGCITFSSLAQGILSNKYLNGIPADSRAASARGNGALEKSGLTEEIVGKVKELNKIAEKRNQSMAQMALAWVLKDPRITSVIIGASKPEQVTDSIACINKTVFEKDELNTIEQILK